MKRFLQTHQVLKRRVQFSSLVPSGPSSVCLVSLLRNAGRRLCGFQSFLEKAVAGNPEVLETRSTARPRGCRLYGKQQRGALYERGGVCASRCASAFVLALGIRRRKAVAHT